MFGYDSAALTPEGKAAIAQLYRNPGLQPAKDKATVVIGIIAIAPEPQIIIQQLSAQRAQAVADELVALACQLQILLHKDMVRVILSRDPVVMGRPDSS